MRLQKAAGLAGGVRLGGDGRRDIHRLADVADVMVDDAALNPHGFQRGLRRREYVQPVGDLVIDLSPNAVRFDEQMSR